MISGINISNAYIQSYELDSKLNVRSANVGSAPVQLGKEESVPRTADTKERLIKLVSGLFKNELAKVEPTIIKIKQGVPSILLGAKLVEIHKQLNELITKYRGECDQAALESNQGKVQSFYNEYLSEKASIIAKIDWQAEIEEARNRLSLCCLKRLQFSMLDVRPSNLEELFYTLELEKSELVETNPFLFNDKDYQYYKNCDFKFYTEHVFFFLAEEVKFMVAECEMQPDDYPFNEVAFEECLLQLDQNDQALKMLEDQKENPLFADKILVVLANHYSNQVDRFIPLMDSYLSLQVDLDSRIKFIAYLLYEFKKTIPSQSVEDVLKISNWMHDFVANEKNQEIVDKLVENNCRATISFLIAWYATKKNWPEAIRYAKIFSSRNPETVAIKDLAKKIMESGNVEVAKTFIQESLNNQNDPEMFCMLGEMLKESDFPLAAKYYGEALSMGYLAALAPLKELSSKIRLNAKTSKLMKSFPVVSKGNSQQLQEMKKAEARLDAQFREPVSSLGGKFLELYRTASEDLRKGFRNQLEGLAYDDKWLNHKDELLDKAQKSQSTLLATFLQEQKEEERKLGLKQQVLALNSEGADKWGQKIAMSIQAAEEAESESARLKSLKLSFESKIGGLLAMMEEDYDLEVMEGKFAEIKSSYESELASIKNATTRLQEKESEIVKLKQRLAELESSNRALIHEAKKSEEKLKAQGEEFDSLLSASISWEEELSKKEERPVFQEIKCILELEMEKGAALHKWLDKLYAVENSVVKKEAMIALLDLVGFKHRATRGSHSYFCREKGGKRVFCLISSHTDELDKGERRACLSRILLSLKEQGVL